MKTSVTIVGYRFELQDIIEENFDGSGILDLIRGFNHPIEFVRADLENPNHPLYTMEHIKYHEWDVYRPSNIIGSAYVFIVFEHNDFPQHTDHVALAKFSKSFEDYAEEKKALREYIGDAYEESRFGIWTFVDDV